MRSYKVATSSLIILALACGAMSFAAGETDSERLVVMSYNIHVGRGLDGVLDLERIAGVIKSVNPDIVSLQEIDKKVARSGRVNQAAELSRLTGMEYVFGRAIDFGGGQYGNVVLSRMPILDSKVVPLPGSELRCALTVTVEIPRAGEEKEKLTFIATHLDHRSHEGRMESIDIIEKIIADADGSLAILAGDINARPGSPEIHKLDETWLNATEAEGFYTFRADNPTHQIDYIFVRPAEAWRVVEKRVLDEPVASDHLPIMTILERKLD